MRRNMWSGNVLIGLIILATLLAMSSGLFSAAPARAMPARAAPPLGTAASFAVLAGSTATNTGDTVVTGDLGVWPGTEVTGFPPGTIVDGTMHQADAVAEQAQSDLVTAYDNLAGQACDSNLTDQDLGGQTLTPGVYCFDTSAQLTGDLTLDAEGDPSAAFVFQIGSTLTTANNSSVSMINSGDGCNVFWQVGSSATLGTETAFVGSILALTSITLNNGADIDGRALAINGAVTMDTNRVNNVCVSAPEPTPTTPEPTATTVEPTATTVEPTATTVEPTATTVAPTPTTVAPTPTTVAPTPTTPEPTATTAEPTATTVAPTPTTAEPTATTVVPTPTGVATVVGFPATGGAALPGEDQSAPRPASVAEMAAPPLLPDSLIDADLDLHGAPVPVPLELQIPSLQMSAPVLAVGVTSENVMDTPHGPRGSAVWQQAFWYRGGVVPGNPGIATIGGHVSGIGGQPALFARLDELAPGDLIVIHNTQSGLDVRFMVTKVAVYPLARAADAAIMERVYGSGPLLGTASQETANGLAHLTLITCSGEFVNGSYDHRLVVYAQRTARALGGSVEYIAPRAQTWPWE